MQAFDVSVIGGGIAGVSAALAARAAGASVALIRAAPGASALGSGAWHGPLPTLIGDALHSAGLPHVPSPHPMPHPMGELHTASFAAASHVAPFAIDTAFLCGIAGLAGFVAPSLARLYATPGSPPLAHMTAGISGTPPAGWAPLALAAAIERDPSIVAAAIDGVIPDGATHILMPAVLGLEGGDAVRASLSTALGRPVFECLGAPPSIPGWRLDRALLRALRSAGVQLITGRVNGFDASQHRITAVHLASDATGGEGAEQSVGAVHFVLASGKFLGGGIATRLLDSHEQGLAETALGLPIWIDHLDQTFATAESLTLTSRVRTYDQPLLRAGVHTNALYRPVDPRDRILYSNVIAVGAVRADIDTAGLGLGVAAEHAIAAMDQLLSTTSQGTA